MVEQACSNNTCAHVHLAITPATVLSLPVSVFTRCTLTTSGITRELLVPLSVVNPLITPPVILLLLATLCFHPHHRVRFVLDRAAAAAERQSGQTGSGGLQQLREARGLYETDRAAAAQLLGRLLADLDDAQVMWEWMYFGW